MESLLLKELKEELLRLEALFEAINEHEDYLCGRMDEIKWVIDLVKQLKQK